MLTLVGITVMYQVIKKDDKNDSMNLLAAAEVSEQVMRTQDKCSDNDSEPDEDQAALDHRQQLTGDALPTVVQINNLENQMYQCAPGKNNIPKYILLDDDFEVLTFPDLFPDGTGAYHSPNGPEHLGIWKSFVQHLLNVDIHFAQNIEYLFCAQYIADIKQIQSDANLAIHMLCGRTFHGERITAGMLHNPNAVKQLVRTEQACEFLKNVSGSCAYWQNELYDVLAMLHSVGIPTWFLTLSAADLHWPEIIQALAVQIGQHLSHEDILKTSTAERSRYLQQNPVTCVCMFQHCVDSLFMHYLLSKTQLLGAIIDYVIKIEFQMRGTPHAQCLLWVKDAPKINVNEDEEICHFTDKYITAVLPTGQAEYEDDVKLMENLLKHTHSDYCQRQKRCHFGFPKPPSYKTVIF